MKGDWVSSAMGQAIDNPISNTLKSGLNINQVDEAIRKSGYPLQVTVASVLRSLFLVEEEWGFREANGGAVRTLDIMAERSFCEWSDPNRFRVRPTLNLLIECKQSDLPFVFFLTDQRLMNYPRVSGLRSNEIKVTTDDDRSTWQFDILSILGLIAEPFLHDAEPCATFSKCVRSGKDLELSGSEAYNSLVMPLVAAFQDFESRCKPPSTAYYFEARVILAVAVLDAPMVGIRVGSGVERSLSFVPWVRLIRNSPPDDSAARKTDPTSEPIILDIVHKDYFEAFLTKHVEPFMLSFKERADKHHEILAEGEAFARGMGGDSSFRNLVEGLQPATRSVAPPPRVYPGWRGVVQLFSLSFEWVTKNIALKTNRLLRRRTRT